MEKQFIYWTNDFSVQIKEIDDQHKVLINIINDLYNAFMQKEHKDLIDEIIDRMAKYAIWHFGVEEKYFAKFGYPAAAEHMKEHKTFLDQIAVYQNDIKTSKVALTFSVMAFLQKWLTNHIVGIDKHYTKCFKANGLI